MLPCVRGLVVRAVLLVHASKKAGPADLDNHFVRVQFDHNSPIPSVETQSQSLLAILKRRRRRMAAGRDVCRVRFCTQEARFEERSGDDLPTTKNQCGHVLVCACVRACECACVRASERVCEGAGPTYQRQAPVASSARCLCEEMWIQKFWTVHGMARLRLNRSLPENLSGIR
jgi:hypothetical protein